MALFTTVQLSAVGYSGSTPNALHRCIGRKVRTLNKVCGFGCGDGLILCLNHSDKLPTV